MRRLGKVLLVTGLLLAVVFAYRVLGVYRFQSGECSARPPARFVHSYPKTLRVMSFNIQGHASLLDGEHIEEVAETIRRHQPDVVAINEAHRRTWQARFDDQTAQLARLTGMTVVFGRSYRFAGGDFGNAVLTRGEVVSSSVHDLPGTGEPRSLLECVIRVNGGTIDFYATHTSAWGSFGRDARRAQLACINAHVRASGRPYIVAGDLNAPADAPEIRAFMGENALVIAGDPGTPTHRVMEQRLDYILTDPRWTVREARVLDDGPSDHYPLLAELTHR
jgi:endonuclease/exonuclease/phosphatase family metal-dependent hydrolase